MPMVRSGKSSPDNSLLEKKVIFFPHKQHKISFDMRPVMMTGYLLHQIWKDEHCEPCVHAREAGICWRWLWLFCLCLPMNHRGPYRLCIPSQVTRLNRQKTAALSPVRTKEHCVHLSSGCSSGCVSVCLHHQKTLGLQCWTLSGLFWWGVMTLLLYSGKKAQSLTPNSGFMWRLFVSTSPRAFSAAGFVSVCPVVFDQHCPYYSVGCCAWSRWDSVLWSH